jgi:hypothetical protein
LNGILASVDQGITVMNATQDWSAAGNYYPIYQPGPNTWPIVLLQQVYVMRDLSQMSSEAQGLLLAFLRALLEPSYIGQCQTTLSLMMMPVPDHIRSIGMDGLELLLRTNTQHTPWAFERQDGVLKPGDYVISERRQSFSFRNSAAVQQKLTYITNKLRTMEEEIAILRKNNEDLNTVLQDLRAALLVQPSSSSSSSSLVYPLSMAPALQPARDSRKGEPTTNVNSLDDDTPLYIRSGLPVFGAVEDQQLHTALVLGSISFTFWSIFFVWKIWRCCLSI